MTLERAEDALQRRALRYDRAGDQHYNTISAWIKATRGSDPDASLYYLAVMLEGGEDARFIARRMVILASEDVGNADPQALVVATAAASAVEHVGMPEAQHALAQAAVYLALAPKSNAAYRAIAAAREHVRTHGAKAPPPALQTAAGGFGARGARPRAATTTTRTTTPGTSASRSSCPTRSWASASTSPTTPRRPCATACRRSDGRAGSRTRNRRQRGPCHPGGVLISATHRPLGAADGAPLRLRLPLSRDHAALRGLLGRLGLHASDLERRRLVAVDPRARLAVCATAWVDGREVLAGYAATSRDGDPEPDVLLVDEAVAPGVGALLRAALAEQSRPRRVA